MSENVVLIHMDNFHHQSVTSYEAHSGRSFALELTRQSPQDSRRDMKHRPPSLACLEAVYGYVGNYTGRSEAQLDKSDFQF
jgi:hypothetical protein